jgi:hypothetical protein
MFFGRAWRYQALYEINSQLTAKTLHIFWPISALFPVWHRGVDYLEYFTYGAPPIAGMRLQESENRANYGIEGGIIWLSGRGIIVRQFMSR